MIYPLHVDRFRFHHTISVSDLFKMRDLVEIVENSNGRTVHLLPGITSASHGQIIVRGWCQLYVSLIHRLV